MPDGYGASLQPGGRGSQWQKLAGNSEEWHVQKFLSILTKKVQVEGRKTTESCCAEPPSSWCRRSPCAFSCMQRTRQGRREFRSDENAAQFQKLESKEA